MYGTSVRKNIHRSKQPVNVGNHQVASDKIPSSRAETHQSSTERDEESSLDIETMPMPSFKPGVVTPIPHERILAIMKREVREGSAQVFSVQLTRVYLSEPSQKLLADCFWYLFLHHFRGHLPDVSYFKSLQMDLMSAHYRSAFLYIHDGEKDIVMEKYPDVAAQTLYSIFHTCFPFSRKFLDEQFKKLLLSACIYWFTGQKLQNPSVKHWHRQKAFQQVVNNFEKEKDAKRKRIDQFFGFPDCLSSNSPEKTGNSDMLVVATDKSRKNEDVTSFQQIRRDLHHLNECGRWERHGYDDLDEAEEVGREEHKDDSQRTEEDPLVGFSVMNHNPVWIDDEKFAAELKQPKVRKDGHFQLQAMSPLVQHYLALTRKGNNSLVTKNKMEEFNVSLKLPEVDPEYDAIIIQGLLQRSAYSILHTETMVADGVSQGCYQASALSARIKAEKIREPGQTRTNATGSTRFASPASSWWLDEHCQSVRSSKSALKSQCSTRQNCGPANTIANHETQIEGTHHKKTSGATSPKSGIAHGGARLQSASKFRGGNSTCSPHHGVGRDLQHGQLPVLCESTIRRPSSAASHCLTSAPSASGVSCTSDGLSGEASDILDEDSLGATRSRHPKGLSDYRRVFRGLDNRAACRRIAKYNEISWSDLRQEMEEESGLDFKSMADSHVQNGKRIQAAVDPDAGRQELIRRNRMYEFHKTQILASSEKKKLIAKKNQARVNDVNVALAKALATMKDLRRLERSDPPDLELFKKYKEVLLLLDKCWPVVSANFRVIFQQFSAIKLPKLRLMVRYYKAHHKAEILQELKSGNAAILDLLMLPDEMDREERRTKARLDFSHVEAKVAGSQSRSMHGILRKKKAIADRAMEKMIEDGTLERPAIHDIQRDLEERKLLRQKLAFQHQLERMLGYHVDFDEWDEEKEETDREEEGFESFPEDGGEDAVLESALTAIMEQENDDPLGTHRSCLSTTSHIPAANNIQLVVSTPFGSTQTILQGTPSMQQLKLLATDEHQADAGANNGLSLLLREPEDSSASCCTEVAIGAQEQGTSSCPTAASQTETTTGPSDWTCGPTPTIPASHESQLTTSSTVSSFADISEDAERFPEQEDAEAIRKGWQKSALLKLGLEEFTFGDVAVLGSTAIWANSQKGLGEKADEMLMSLKSRKRAQHRSYQVIPASLT